MLLPLSGANYMEAARGLALRMMNAKTERIEFGFRLATGRSPSTAEAAELRKCVDFQLAEFRRNPGSARKLIGASVVNAHRDACELAAWTLTANLLLNLDDVQTMR